MPKKNTVLLELKRFWEHVRSLELDVNISEEVSEHFHNEVSHRQSRVGNICPNVSQRAKIAANNEI